MKKILSSFVRWAGIAALAAVLFPQKADAYAGTEFKAHELRVQSITTYTWDGNNTIFFLMPLDLDDPLDELDTTTIPEDFGLKFCLPDGSVRTAAWAGTTKYNGSYALRFMYEVQQNDYSGGGLRCVEGFQFVGTKIYDIKSKGGDSDGGEFYGEGFWPAPEGTMIPLENQMDIENLKINPSNATKFSVNFLDEYGERIPSTQVAKFTEGQTGIQYVINIGSTPPEDSPVEVIVDWGVENVFCEGSQTTNYVTAAEQIFTIEQILDDGPAPSSSHDYTVKAITAGRSDATMKARVVNESPVLVSFSADTLFGTNVVLAVGETITVTAFVEDLAGELDDPLTAKWKFGSQDPTSVENTWNGNMWTTTASGTIIKGGITSISLVVTDKNGGSVTTNDIVYAEQGPLVMANPADTIQNGMVNLGDGTISIVQPGSGTIAWDPNGNYLSGVKAVLRANAYTAAESADGYDSFYYKWYNGEDEGLEKNDPVRGLVDGYDPISRQATLNLLADSSAPFADRAPMDRVVKYFFSKEKYRPDNFGDIDGDRLGDEWEIKWFSQSALNFTDPVTGEPVLPAESGAPVRADQATLVYDFSNTGNMDGDGLPANCFANMDYTVDADILDADGNVMISAGTYNIQTFAYPLPANSVSRFGYLPLGGTHMVDYEEEADILAFRSNPYVDQNALNRILVDFSNELEFRGVGLYNQFVDDAGETIDFRPYGDGDEPNTNPMVADTDSDGMPDGWEYYFWAVAYYNINPDQWLSFNGATPSGGSYQGTGDFISRDDILSTFDPTSAAFVDEDLDHDGLTNLEEFALGTNPIHWDTDGDGIPDGWEVMYGIVGGTGTTTTIDPETGATTTTVDNTRTIALNPLKANDGNYNDDGDYFAIDGDLRHYDVFLAYDFDPRVGWCDPRRNSVSYAGNSFETEYPYTATYTALEEFNLAAWYVEHGYVASVQGIDPNADNYWGKWTTDPLSPDTDGDGIPDGWEAYVGLNPNLAADAGQDLEKDLLHPQGDGLNNLQEFLCTMAAEIYPYIAEKYQAQIDEWPNKPWPTNPNLSIGFGYAHGGDTDNDQVLDGAEKGPNCNPTCVDTDHDYLPDLWECYYGTDPLAIDTYEDYDGDGLQNWQEYMTGAVWAWQYDKWYNAFRGTMGPGYGEVDMFDFFVDAYSIGDYQDATHHNYGGFGRAPHAWDCASGASARQGGIAGAGAPFFFLSAEVRSRIVDPKLIDSTGLIGYGFDGYGVAEDRNFGAVTFATADPWATDSDHDGMDDFYEAYHGLNPLYGGAMLAPDFDLVGMIDPVTMSPYPSNPWDLTVYPWLSGDPDADPDKDGLSSREECANFYVEGGVHHTDPSPYWLTDSSYERSFVNLYYQPGCSFAITLPPYWYFGIDSNASSPVFAYSFEMNEGYDTDNDNVGDRSELTTDELQAHADPLDFDNPRRRKAMYFNGIDAACRTREGSVCVDEADLRTFTIEAWICPVNPASGRIQTLVERASIVKQDTAKGDVVGKRLNFRLSITETGALRGEFHNYQGSHVTMETEAVNTGLRAGIWNHVAMTYSGTPAKAGTLTVYVNGVSKKSTASNLQAFNGVLQGFTSKTDEEEETYLTEYACPIVLGASDMNPAGEINGYQDFVHGGIVAPGVEPVLTDYYEGWMDEVRIWNGARSEEAIRATMYTRFDREDALANQEVVDSMTGLTLNLRHHYTFDNLPDVVPSADRSPDAALYPSDIETLPTGMGEVFTAPNDGSYPGVPWWNSSSYVGYRYDARHIQWIEDTCLHLGGTNVVDSLRMIPVVDEATGAITGYREQIYTPEYENSALVGVTTAEGLTVDAANLPNGGNPYVCTYATHSYTDEGVSGGATTWSSDLLPLGGAVADMDMELWDGLGVGYELVSEDSDGDGIPNYWENLYGLDPFDASDAWEDFDGDGLDNLAEYLAGTSPIEGDTDGDGYSDYYDRDSDKSLTYGEIYDDGDGMPSWWEFQYGLNPRVYDADDDLDGDGWSNYQEYLAGTDPTFSENFPIPPLYVDINYFGKVKNGQVVVYAYSNERMDGEPDAIYRENVPTSEAQYTVESEYQMDVRAGKTVYSGRFAHVNILTDGSLTIRAHKSRDVYINGLSAQTEANNDDLLRPVIIINADGEEEEVLMPVGNFDPATGEWWYEASIDPDEYDGVPIIASYTSSDERPFPMQMRCKWADVGALKSGNTWFFAFIDENGDGAYTTGEPAGMALYQPITVWNGDVEIEIPLTDSLTGFPRFGWTEVAGADQYTVTVANDDAVEFDAYAEPYHPAREFFMEQDLLAQGGMYLSDGKYSLATWSVRVSQSDLPESDDTPMSVTGPIIAEGGITNDIAVLERKTLQILYPAEGSVVSDASIAARWKMDYRNQGVHIVVKNTDSNKIYIDTICYFPQRMGSLSDDYYYTIEPQKILGSGSFIDLPDGNYALTIMENIRSEAVTKQYATTYFVIDHGAAADSNAKAKGLGSLGGTLVYYGKVPFTVADEIVGSFDGTAQRLVANLGRSPIPGTVTVKVVVGGEVVFMASDTGAKEGNSRQGLYSSYGSMIQIGSYVEYGDVASVSLELETAPAAGAQLVVSYKQYDCPIRVQAFSPDYFDGAVFSTPVAQTTVYNKGAFLLEGLPAGTYYLRAFIDQDGDSILDDWEAVGYAMETVNPVEGKDNFASFAVPPGASNVEILIADKDTDSDQLPDSWEYYYFGDISTQGGQTQKKVGVYLWQEYADGELDSNPLVEDTDGDGFPDVLEHLYGTDNHAWDSDGDGVGDLEEFLAGSDPADASSVARFKAPAPTFLEDGTPALVLETPALSQGLYVQYTVLGKANLGDAWSTIGETDFIGVEKDAPSGIGRSTVTIPDTSAGEASFYKVKVSFESDTLL